MAKPALYTLLALFSASHLSSALQVSPNSPCASVCRDSLDLDSSDPNSSNTKNSDITCQDAAYSSPAGTKFKSCMTCLQTSTFSQGSESDTMWFLYNLRYTAAYCVFGFPNAAGIASTPCSTSTACGRLQASMEHGILDPKGTTAYSYCSAGDGDDMAFSHFESCIPCISAEGTTEYLANYFVALEAGCRQQPAPGVLLGLSDTVFSDTQISIVDPTTLNKDESSKPVLTVPVIVGIVVGAVVLLLIIAGATFICLRKRRNKRVRASAEADFYARVNRHRSSMSFQCQTQMVSPRFWPVAEEGASTPVVDSPDVQAYRSSSWKPQEPYQQDATAAAPISKKAAAAPLHITTTVPPTPPPQAYTSPSSAATERERAHQYQYQYHSPSDFGRSPLSAESARSTSALLPSLKPYIPAEHGVHVQGSSSSSPTIPTATAITITSPGGATSPGAVGTGMTPLLKSHAWPLPEQQQGGAPGGKRHIIKLSTVPPPPPLKTTSRSSGGGGGGGMLPMMGRKSPRISSSGGGFGGGGDGAAGSPVESWEIQTAFAAPPGGRR
ncbi:hypothetical protein C8A01DRAFT_16588 [Parachaetomium inaequale]|uniref:LPXTG-domain-containing protein n=1 Tax=Parachaetomium inaequale TaxID=2588326 RepID=A0AAN6PI61_9PEZI|nr:hypothetical protein C8A01DRAFT_16588 [Parachaetomium inaequale]